MYVAVVETLRRHFGSVTQAEMYGEQLKGRTRQPGESLPHLAQAMELLVRHAYPVAPEEMVTVLSQETFIDALEDQQMEIYVKQAHPEAVQQALARAFLCTSGAAMTLHRRLAAQNPPLRHLPVRNAQVQQGRRKRTSSGGLSGFCWKCGQRGHHHSDCLGERRTGSLEDVRARSPTTVCCENCGQQGHRCATCWQLKDVMMVGETHTGWEVDPLSSYVVPGPHLCKVPPRCCCAGGPSVRRNGWPPVSPGGGHGGVQLPGGALPRT